MFTQFNNIVRFSFLISISFSLIACGGGGGGGSLPATDTTPPRVVSTKPGSEAEGIRPGTEIIVTFNESVSGVLKTNIDIYPVDLGVPNQSAPIDFQLIISPDSFTIAPNIGALEPKRVYQVTIIGVKDTTNNQMVKPCVWLFATTGATDSIKNGNPGVCGATVKDPIPNPVEGIIIDTDEKGTSFVGKWGRNSTTPEKYGAIQAHAAVGGEPKSYRFTPTIPQASLYEVYVWNSCFDNRPKRVPHTIQHANGFSTIYVDQSCSTGTHGEWFLLGKYNFNVGEFGYLEISDNGIIPPAKTIYIGADAARFVRVAN